MVIKKKKSYIYIYNIQARNRIQGKKFTLKYLHIWAKEVEKRSYINYQYQSS